jgi:hypothetical protein
VDPSGYCSWASNAGRTRPERGAVIRRIFSTPPRTPSDRAPTITLPRKVLFSLHSCSVFSLRDKTATLPAAKPPARSVLAGNFVQWRRNTDSRGKGEEQGFSREAQCPAQQNRITRSRLFCFSVACSTGQSEHVESSPGIGGVGRIHRAEIDHSVGDRGYDKLG